MWFLLLLLLLLSLCRLECGSDLVSIPALLAELYRRGILSLMVEGGGRVISSFLKSGLVDSLVVTLAPSFIGQGGLSYKADLGSSVSDSRV